MVSRTCASRKGPTELFVSQTRYVTFGLPVEVAADMTARAELFLEPVHPLVPSEHYYP